VKAVEKNFFHGELERLFVKGKDPKDYPTLMSETLGDDPVMETDYSSMEAHHEGIRSQIFTHLMAHSLRGSGFSNHERRLIMSLCKGVNVMRSRVVTATVKQRLMTGISWTSLANAILNLVTTTFLVFKSKDPQMTIEEMTTKLRDFKGLFEGDDGICVASEIDDTIITKLGIKLKFEMHSNFTEASFCGCTSARNDLQVLTNHEKVIRTMFRLPPKLKDSKDKTHMIFLRAKALSAYYNYRNCPVVGELAWSIIERTRGYDVQRAVMSETDLYKRNSIVRAINAKPWEKGKPQVSEESRAAYHKRFGWHPDKQMELETSIRNATDHIIMDVDLKPHELMINRHLDDDHWPIPPMPTQLEDAFNQVTSNKLGKQTHPVGCRLVSSWKT
jgi:hypothetical protein